MKACGGGTWARVGSRVRVRVRVRVTVRLRVGVGVKGQG